MILCNLPAQTVSRIFGCDLPGFTFIFWHLMRHQQKLYDRNFNQKTRMHHKITRMQPSIAKSHATRSIDSSLLLITQKVGVSIDPQEGHILCYACSFVA